MKRYLPYSMALPEFHLVTVFQWVAALQLMVASQLVTAPQAFALDDSHAPVVVELFTSEGCSSCPPADKLLAELSAGSKAGAAIVVVSEHVDYWDYLGWKDPFSRAVYTERQHAYARAFRQNSVYTPEMVVNGVKGFNGSDARSAADAISNKIDEPKLRLALKAVLAPNKTTVNVSVAATGDSALVLGKDEQLIVFLTQDKLSVAVKSGENGGRTLSHTGVARDIKTFEQLPKSQLSLVVPANAAVDSLKVVAIKQNMRTMAITGSGVTRVAVK